MFLVWIVYQCELECTFLNHSVPVGHLVTAYCCRTVTEAVESQDTKSSNGMKMIEKSK